jgi:hypothetical protein
MLEKDADTYLISSIYDINWLFNIRGNDTAHTPLLTAYALVTADQAALFVDEAKLTDGVREGLVSSGVGVAPYDTVFGALEKLLESATVYLCEERVSMALRRCIKSKVVTGTYKVYPRMAKIAKGQVDNQTAEDFFTILNLVLNDPSMTLMVDSIKETYMLKHLESLGIGKGNDFQWSKLDKATQDALTAGFKAGFKKVRDALKSNLINLNGWMEVRNSGGFETQWLDRAVMADAGWAGPDRNVSHTGAFLFVDNDGKPLDGKNRYTMTFDMNDLPPVSQFWSIPIYNKDGYFVRNPIDRYTINSFMVDQKQLHAADGKLVIYVQKDKPSDPNQLKNWLPAPEGSFRFAARFYGPKMAIIDGSYKMPRPVKVN